MYPCQCGETRMVADCLSLADAEPQSSQLPVKKQPPLTGVVAIHDDKSVSHFSEANPHTTAPAPEPRNYVVPFVCTMMSNIALDPPHSDPEVPAAASLVVSGTLWIIIIHRARPSKATK